MSRSKMYWALLQTNGTFNSDPPFAFAAAKEGGITIYVNNWGNTDNTLIADVYWGEKTIGLLANSANMIWAKDSTLTTTIPATGGVSTKVVGFIEIPHMVSKFMRIGFTLGGTTKTADVVAWFNWRAD
jgi:hypothetical protein